MTNPPPPDNWGPPPSPFDGGPPQPPHGPGQWQPQQGWGQPLQPPKNNSLKWLLIGVAVLLVIAISVGATLLFTRDGGDSTQQATGTSAAPGDIASANDTGPVTVITEDPTCEPWRPIIDTLARQERQGWEQRDYSQPATSWSETQRAMYDSVATAMRSAADQTVALARMTPHRVMRELYEQSIAYWRAYADSVPTYTAKDNSLAVVARNSTGALVSICGAIDHGSASTRSHLARSDVDAPSIASPPKDPASTSIFLTSSAGGSCAEWESAANHFDNEIAEWQGIDPNIPASDWTAPQRAAVEAAAPVMLEFSDRIYSIGKDSGNPVFADFAALAAQYWHAFASSTPSFVPADAYLSATAAYSEFLVRNACVFAES